MALVVTSDGGFFNAITDSKTIQHVIEECDGNTIIPLPTIDSKMYKNILFFSEHGVLESYDSVCDVAVAADYLHYDTLLQHCCKHIAELIKGKTREQINKIFGTE